MNEYRMRGRILVVGAVLALALGACGGSSTATSPASSTGAGASTGAASQTPAPSEAPVASTGVDASVAPAANDPIGALSGLSSYKIRFSMGGSGTTGSIAALGNITMAGTIVTKPDPAADITMSIGGASPDASAASSAPGLSFHVIEKDGKTWSDATGSMVLQTDSSSTSMVDSLSPEKLLGGLSSYTSQMKTVGDEQKNGVATTHLQADEATLSAATSSLALLGLTNAKWSWDIWVAKDGGYAVSYIMKGTGDGGASMSISLDLSDVNSTSNVVTAP
jgi:hypothetical protein